MAKLYRAWEIEQTLLLPATVQEFVPAGHEAHLIRDTVRELLDLNEIYDSYANERGQPPYHPAMMTALLLYAYSRGIYSSRRIMQACEERVDVMAVTGMQRPDFRTINEFRQRHGEALQGLFRQVLRLCRRAGLVSLGHVALDGTKLRANASKHKAMSYGRMDEAEGALERQVRGWFEEAAREDRREEERESPEVPGWVASKQARLEKIREAKAALEAEARRDRQDGDGGSGTGGEGTAEVTVAPGAQRNFTDPESKIMKRGTEFLQGYNAQAAVDERCGVIVAQAVTNHAADVHELAPMVAAIEAGCEQLPRELSADAGYCSESNCRLVAARGIAGYIAPGRQRHGSAAPRPTRTAAPGSAVAAMALRLRRAGHRSRYRLRKQIVEPVFGQIKAARGFRQFLLRGLAGVRLEWSLLCSAHNLLKLVHQ
jgi:transposase